MKKITNHGSFKTWEGDHPSIQINTLKDLPPVRYAAALIRIREKIQSGRPLDAYDDETPGNKSMGCSWGFCDESRETWPDAQDHIFPLDFIKNGHTSPLSLGIPNTCPMDTRTKSGQQGCFYTCRVFQASRKKPAPTKEEAVRLYDAKISSLEGKI